MPEKHFFQGTWDPEQDFYLICKLSKVDFRKKNFETDRVLCLRHPVRCIDRFHFVMKSDPYLWYLLAQTGWTLSQDTHLKRVATEYNRNWSMVPGRKEKECEERLSFLLALEKFCQPFLQRVKGSPQAKACGYDDLALQFFAHVESPQANACGNDDVALQFLAHEESSQAKACGNDDVALQFLAHEESPQAKECGNDDVALQFFAHEESPQAKECRYNDIQGIASDYNDDIALPFITQTEEVRGIDEATNELHPMLSVDFFEPLNQEVVTTQAAKVAALAKAAELMTPAENQEALPGELKLAPAPQMEKTAKVSLLLKELIALGENQKPLPAKRRSMPPAPQIRKDPKVSNLLKELISLGENQKTLPAKRVLNVFKI